MVEAVITKAVDWLGRQQSVVVVLIAILIAICYAANTYFPQILESFSTELQLLRESNAKQIQELRIDDREQRQMDRKVYESTMGRMIDVFERKHDAIKDK